MKPAKTGKSGRKKLLHKSPTHAAPTEKTRTPLNRARRGEVTNPIRQIRRRLSSPAEDDDETKRLDEEYMGRELRSLEKQSRARLAEMLWRFRLWFKVMEDGSANTDLGFKLEELNETVLTLAAIVRKRPPGVLWNSYIAINRRFRKLHLVKEIERLVVRAVRNVPQRPIATLIRLNSTVPEDLLNVWRKWRDGQKDAAPQNWRDFEPLFNKWRTSKKAHLKKVGTQTIDVREQASPEHITFASFLEVTNDDAAWIARFFNAVSALRMWIERDLCNQALADIGEPLFNDSADPNYGKRISERHAENRRHWGRKMARLRQARHRAQGIPVKKRHSG